MAGSINNVDFIAIIKHRGLFSSNRNAALMLLIARVHNESLGHLGLIITKSMGLFKQPIYERSLAMVDMRDNCDVTDIFFMHAYYYIIFWSDRKAVRPLSGAHERQTKSAFLKIQ